VLHVLPDSLSRMYASAYIQESMVWGTHNNIKILDDFDHFSSPSDFLCKQSIADAKPIKVVKKRHIVENFNKDLSNFKQRSGEGNREAVSDSSESDSSSLSLVSAAAVIDDDLQPVIISEDQHNEFLLSHTYAPLYACQDTCLPVQLCAIMDLYADRPFTEQQALDDEQARQELAKKGYVVVPTSILTDEEKLLIAQEKRGRSVPVNDTVKKQLVEQAHLAGHFGEKAMLAHIDRLGFWWPELRADITKEIINCTACQRHSITHHGYAPSQSIFSARPCDHYQMDLCQLPESREGWKFCLVVIDVFTGFIMLEPIPNKEASTVARALWKICCVIGLPRILQSDNGTEFCNQIIESLCRLTGISRRYIAPYNPRADGKVERSIKTVKQMIVKLFHGTASMWPLYVPFVQLMYNNKVHELTGATPFSLMFGRVLNEVRDYSMEPYKPVNLNDWKLHQDKIVSLIYPAINERVKGKQEVYRKKVDALRKKIIKDELVPGSLVMIKDPIYLLNPSTRPTAEPLFIGPYSIVRRTLYGPYILRDDTGELYPRQVPIDQMKVLYTPSLIAPEERKGGDTDIYDVDYIMNHKEEDGEYLYHVKWKGYDKKDSTWEPEQNINDPQSIERYYRLLVLKQKTKKRK
jgi:transposase InsO family protein